MYSEYEVNRQIQSITGSDDTSLRKARRLVTLSRGIRRFALKLSHGAVILRNDEDEGADRLQQTLNGLRKLQEEARIAALNILKSEPKALGFPIQSVQNAFPARWAESKERMDARPSYN
jgi:hypothetical protein